MSCGEHRKVVLVEVNVDAARELGLHGIHFRDTDQVIAELDALVL